MKELLKLEAFVFITRITPVLLACLPLSLLGMGVGEKMAIQNTLYGLQELRTVIPERLWTEEFAVLVDNAAFEKAAKETDVPAHIDPDYLPSIAAGSSKYYFLYAATTGEPIRLDDRYLQFLDSPYWNSPDAVRKLYYLQHNYMKVPR